MRYTVAQIKIDKVTIEMQLTQCGYEILESGNVVGLCGNQENWQEQFKNHCGQVVVNHVLKESDDIPDSRIVNRL